MEGQPRQPRLGRGRGGDRKDQKEGQGRTLARGFSAAGTSSGSSQSVFIKSTAESSSVSSGGLSGTSIRPSAPSLLSLGRGSAHRTEEEKAAETIKKTVQIQETIKEGGDNGKSSGATTSSGGNGSGSTSVRGALRGKRTINEKIINEIIITKPKLCTSKNGSTGREVVLQTNYFRVDKKPEWNLYQYAVEFAPNIEYLRVRKGIIYSHKEKFGANIFDGSTMFCCRRINDADLEFATRSNINNEEVIKIKLKQVGILSPTDYQSLQILNLILRKSMEGLKLQLVGRNLFDAIAKIKIREYGLELWPGYVTSFRQHEKDILLCTEIAHKCMRTETLYHILQRCVQEDRNYKDNFKKEVIGTVVLTDYNNKTYRVDDVNFESSPLSTFDTKDGPINYVDYYKKRYNLPIKDPRQPLLVSKSTEKKRRGGEEEFIMLIPELCRSTGITDAMRADFKVMSAISNHTRLTPQGRMERLKVFNQRLYATKESMDVLNNWQLTLDKHLVEVPGRILNPEVILMGNGHVVTLGDKPDWTNEFRNKSMFVTNPLKRWYYILSRDSDQPARDFLQKIFTAAKGMRMEIAEPRIIVLNDTKNGTLVQCLEECANKDPQLICVVVPNTNADKYSCIKKKLCVDRAIPSQVITKRSLNPKNDKKALSTATKIVIQLNCKIMGVPWNIKIPVKGLMTVGFDVCHSTRDKSKSYGAMVATMDLRVNPRFYSTVSEHVKGTELSNEISVNMTKALREYRELHGTLPERILFYRDGVGVGELNQVYQHEVQNLLKCLQNIYASADTSQAPRMCFIVVSKRINTRYFHNAQNPCAGTVVDDVITLPERYDFYLVSQHVTQGTVSPTSYNIIHDETGLSADHLQILTYKFTHLYYNWTGTLRVPAVCQYAHKLAYLVGQSIHQAPNCLLEKQLYFL